MTETQERETRRATLALVVAVEDLLHAESKNFPEDSYGNSMDRLRETFGEASRALGLVVRV